MEAEPFGAPPLSAAGARSAAAHLARAEAMAQARSDAIAAGAELPARPAVLGSGPSAVSLAAALAMAGLPVTLVEPDPHDATRASDLLGRFLAREAPAAAWCVVSAAPEADLLLAPEPEALGPAVLVPGPPLAVALAGAPLAELAGQLADPARLIGLTLMPPAHATRLAEIVPLPATAPGLHATAHALAGRLGRIVLEAAGAPLAESLVLALHDAADRLLIEGVEPWTLDAAMAAFGYDPGPLEAQDLAGLPALAAARARRTDGPPELPTRPRMLAEGRLGKAAGVGWYRYPGGGGAVIDPLIEDLVREEAHFAGIDEAARTAGEVREALLLAQIAEAAHLLASGAARGVAALDLASVHGAGFPAARGGVLHHAATVGAARLGAALDRLEGLLLPDRVAALRRWLAAAADDPAPGMVAFGSDDSRQSGH